jgi:CRP-like cAMP-binding protein
LEARSADTAQRLHSGDVFGESGVLLGSVRSADVFVIARDTWVLSLSERALRSLVTEHPGAAAKLWRNIATILRDRLNEGGLVTG